MKAFFFAFTYGILFTGTTILTINITDNSKHIDYRKYLWIIIGSFIIGYILGLIIHYKRTKKLEEEKKRQEKQDKLNEMMREYLEKKLQEENEREQFLKNNFTKKKMPGE